MLDRPEARVAAFPTLLLLISAGSIGLFSARRPLWWAVVAAAGISGCWLTLLLLEARLPLATELSVWRPVTLFGQGLLLVLDDRAWGSAVAVCGLLLAIGVSRVGESDPEAADLGWALALGAFALLGALAGNMLTLIIGWSLMGACRMAWRIFAVDRDPVGGDLVRLGGQEMAAPLLLMQAAYLDQVAAGPADVFSPLRSAGGALMFLLAIIVRSAPWATRRAQIDRPSRSRARFSAFQLLPPAAALALLARVELSAMAPATATAGQWLGLLTFVAAAVGWILFSGREASPSWLAWALSGLGLMLACAGVADGVQALTVLVVLLGGLQSIPRVLQPWQRLWPMLGFVAAVGVPATPGAGLVASLGRRMLSGEMHWVWIVVLAGMAIVAAGVLQEALDFRKEDPGAASSHVRGTDLAGLALVATSLVISMQQGWLRGGLSLAPFAATTLAALSLAWWAWRWRTSATSFNLPSVNLSPVGRLVNSASSGVLRAVGSVVALFEGRAGLLWMFLVLLAAWLAVQA